MRAWREIKLTKTVQLHLYSQSEPIIYESVKNTYQKGDLFCILHCDNATNSLQVDKFPIQHIFRIIEEY